MAGKTTILPTTESSTGSPALVMARMRMLAPTHRSMIGSAAAPRIFAMSLTTGIGAMSSRLAQMPSPTAMSSGLRARSRSTARITAARPPSPRIIVTMSVTTVMFVTGMSRAVTSVASASPSKPMSRSATASAINELWRAEPCKTELAVGPSRRKSRLLSSAKITALPNPQ